MKIWKNKCWYWMKSGLYDMVVDNRAVTIFITSRTKFWIKSYCKDQAECVNVKWWVRRVHAAQHWSLIKTVDPFSFSTLLHSIRMLLHIYVHVTKRPIPIFSLNMGMRVSMRVNLFYVQWKQEVVVGKMSGICIIAVIIVLNYCN